MSLRPQPRIQVGWEVRPSFSVSQNGDRSELIMLLPHVFACDSIRPDWSDRTLKFEIRSLNALLINVIPFFDVPVALSKRREFELFREICHLMRDRRHLSRDGLIAIADLAQQMNRGVRRYTAAMIGATMRGEGIVCAPGNRGTT